MSPLPAFFKTLLLLAQRPHIIHLVKLLSWCLTARRALRNKWVLKQLLNQKCARIISINILKCHKPQFPPLSFLHEYERRFLRGYLGGSWSFLGVKLKAKAQEILNYWRYSFGNRRPATCLGNVKNGRPGIVHSWPRMPVVYIRIHLQFCMHTNVKLRRQLWTTYEVPMKRMIMKV